MKCVENFTTTTQKIVVLQVRKKTFDMISHFAHLISCLMSPRSDESIVWPLHSFP